jgi:cardiolipin hydrolase
MDAFFFPDLKNVTKLVNYLGKAQRSLKICVFNLTNDDIAKAILDRWNSNVDVKIITDDECMNNQGSDIRYLAGNGIPVRTDDNPQTHMHNKFVIVDD